MMINSVQKKEIERSLDRLQYFFQNPKTPLSELIPAFYYTTDILTKFSREDDNNWEETEPYYKKFNYFMDRFLERDISKMKVHEKEIVDEIVEMVNDNRFLRRLNSDQKSAKKSSFLGSVAHSNSKGKDQMFAGSFWSEISQNHQNPNQGQKLDSIRRKEEYSRRHKSNQASKISSNGIKEENEELIHRLKQAFSEHQIDEAQKLRKQIKSKKIHIQGETKKLMQKIKFEYNRMNEFHSEFDKQGWKYEKQKGGIRIYSKLDDGDPVAGVKMQGQFRIPIQNFLAILAQADLFQEYVPFCHQSQELHRMGRNQIIGRSVITIPFLKNRGMLFYSAGYDRMKHNGTVFIYSCTITQQQALSHYGYKAVTNPNQVKLDYKYFIVQYTPITIDKAKVRIASKVDMNMKLVPQFILKASALKFGYDYFDNIRKINQKFKGSPWQDKMRINPALYEFFVDKIAEYFSSEKKEGTSDNSEKIKTSMKMITK